MTEKQLTSEVKDIRKIKTKLKGKDDVFRTLALGESTKLPVLLVGVPGVAKTQTLLDYAAAKYEYDRERVRKSSFVIELDEGTKTSEIKGRIDMKELLENKTYKMETPIANAEFILINEVDKGSSGVRNTMLSVMRERALFLGGEVKRCNWTIFAGSCNEITTDQTDAPFWDRFVIKEKVERVELESLGEVWDGKEHELNVPVPNKQEIDNCIINKNKLGLFAKAIYPDITDRTCTYIPVLVKAVKLIWNCSDLQAIVKVCNYIAPHQTQNISSQLEDSRVTEIKSKISQINGIKDVNLMTVFLGELQVAIEKFSKENPTAQEEIMEIKKELSAKVSRNKVCKEIVKARQKIQNDVESMMLPQEESDHISNRLS
jgi:hypothetical protein